MDLDMHVLFACDENYVNYLSVVISSLLGNASKSCRLNFHVIDENLSGKSKEKLSRLFSNADCSIDYIPLPKLRIDTLPIGSWKHSIYAKLLAAELLPNLSKVLWLDVDILVCGDLLPLWNKDLSKHALAAVAEETLSPSQPIQHKKRLGLPKSARYYNAGVLLLNLDFWRENNVVERIFLYLTQHQKNNLIFFEQDAINYVLQDAILEVDCRFNFFPFAEKGRSIIKQLGQPVIVHFIVNKKPWLYRKVPFLLPAVEGYSWIRQWWNYADRLHVFSGFSVKLKPYLRYYFLLLPRAFVRFWENFFRNYIRRPLKKFFTR